MTPPHRPLTLAGCLALATGLVACGGDDTPYTSNGVADVRKACDVRATWSNQKAAACLQCMALSPTERCSCPVQSEFVGRCAQQSALRNAEPQCDDELTRCLGGCGDCACQDACYGKKEACRRKAGAVDGCVTATCDAVCR